MLRCSTLFKFRRFLFLHVVIPALKAGIQHNDRASAEYFVAARCCVLDSRLRGNDNESSKYTTKPL